MKNIIKTGLFSALFFTLASCSAYMGGGGENSAYYDPYYSDGYYYAPNAYYGGGGYYGNDGYYYRNGMDYHYYNNVPYYYGRNNERIFVQKRGNNTYRNQRSVRNNNQNSGLNRAAEKLRTGNAGVRNNNSSSRNTQYRSNREAQYRNNREVQNRNSRNTRNNNSSENGSLNKAAEKLRTGNAGRR